MLRLRTFGGLTLERDGVRLDELIAQRKVLALLAVLARSGEAGIGRERLMALLWADSDMDRARGSLKQMLHTLRRQLHPDVVTGTSDLHINRSIVSSDVADFADLISSGDLQQAVELYSGRFLDGVHIERAPDFSHWQDAERSDLHRTYLTALETLARDAEARGSYDEAVAWWLRCRAADPLRARSVLALMNALDRTGDRAEALRHAQMHDDLLREELGAFPDADVAALAGQLRASTASTASTASAREAPQRRNTGSPVTGSPSGPVPQPQSRASDSPSRSGRWYVAIGVVITVLTAALIAGVGNRPSTPVPTDSRRIVVAMFQNQTGDSTLNTLQLLAADWITRGITSTPGVDMLFPGVLIMQGRTASGAPTSALELARNNGAQLAIAGTFYRTGDSLFFAASLLDVPSGRVIRAIGPFPSKASDPLEGIEALRQGATVALGAMLDLRVSDFVPATIPVPRLDAYREFMIGEELHWRGDMTNAVIHFERAGQLDTSFHLVAARLAITAARADRCDLVDSISTAISSRVSSLSASEKPWVLASVATCDGNMEEVARLHREIAALHPRSPLPQWALAAAARRANYPAEAWGILKTFDPDHDLGWFPRGRMLFFWRELVNAQHALGDYSGEWKTADRFAHTDPGPVMSYYYKARSFAGRHDPDAAVAMVDSIQSLPPEPVVTGEASRVRPIRAATSGWTMYGISEELLAHGYPARARAIGKRTIDWVNGRTEEEKRFPEYRLMLGRAYMMTGQYREARALLADLAKEFPTNIEHVAGFGRSAALSGDTATARRIGSSLATTPGQPRGAGARVLGRAQIAAALGDTAAALSELESLPFRVHPTDFLLLHSDAGLSPLHNQPRFTAFIRPRG